MPIPLRSIITELHSLRRDFSPQAICRTAELLSALAQSPLQSARTLLDAHHELLFLIAFPKTPSLARKATRLIGRTYRAVQQLPSAQRHRLRDTGLAGTRSSHTFMFGSTRWLADHEEAIALHPDTESTWEQLEPLIRHHLLPAEDDAFDDSGLSTKSWVARASGHTSTPLSWLLSGSSAQLETAWSSAEPVVSWELHNSPWSVTRNRAPVAPDISSAPFRRPPPHVADLLETPAPRITRLRGDTAIGWLDAARAALLARCREVTPTMYPNLGELYLADLGEQTALLIVGADHHHRLALEANYGYVLFAGGVPVGYGGVTPLAGQANTGINLFDAFRQSEAPWLFARALQTFHTLFGIHRFVVNPYQFGAGNDEALASGAYWLYDRLGFRAASAEGGALAARERQHLARTPQHRTSLRSLKRLARDDLILELPGATTPLFAERNLVNLGLLVARHLNHTSGAGRDAWLTARGRHWLTTLTGSRRSLRPREQRGFRLLGPVIDLIASDIAHWTSAERAALWALVQAKGAPQERRFARLACHHPRFWAALTRISHPNR